jgi:ERCC4-type nuclease
MVRVPPKSFDWQPTLIAAAQHRRDVAARARKNSEFRWNEIYNKLRANPGGICVQKSGENKGCLRGMPKSIKAGPELETLLAIVRGEKPAWEGAVWGPGALAAAEAAGTLPRESAGGGVFTPGVSQESQIEQCKTFRNRHARDCIFGLLAAMYSEMRDFPTIMNKTQILRAASHFTDEPLDTNHFQHTFGAWSSMKQLNRNGYVHSQKKGMGVQVDHHLTIEGLKLCHALFTKKFPEHGVRPRLVNVSADGRVTPLGSGGGGGGAGGYRFEDYASPAQLHGRGSGREVRGRGGDAFHGDHGGDLFSSFADSGPYSRPDLGDEEEGEYEEGYKDVQHSPFVHTPGYVLGGERSLSSPGVACGGSDDHLSSQEQRDVLRALRCSKYEALTASNKPKKKRCAPPIVYAPLTSAGTTPSTSLPPALATGPTSRQAGHDAGHAIYPKQEVQTFYPDNDDDGDWPAYVESDYDLQPGALDFCPAVFVVDGDDEEEEWLEDEEEQLQVALELSMESSGALEKKRRRSPASASSVSSSTCALRKKGVVVDDVVICLDAEELADTSFRSDRHSQSQSSTESRRCSIVPTGSRSSGGGGGAAVTVIDIMAEEWEGDAAMRSSASGPRGSTPGSSRTADRKRKRLLSSGPHAAAPPSVSTATAILSAASLAATAHSSSASVDAVKRRRVRASRRRSMSASDDEVVSLLDDEDDVRSVVSEEAASPQQSRALSAAEARLTSSSSSGCRATTACVELDLTGDADTDEEDEEVRQVWTPAPTSARACNRRESDSGMASTAARAVDVQVIDCDALDPSIRSSSSSGVGAGRMPAPLASPCSSLGSTGRSLSLSLASYYSLAVDSKERRQEKTYRELFRGIRDATVSYMSSYDVFEHKLPLGDFMTVRADSEDCLNKENIKGKDGALVGFCIERKTMQDIVSRSAGDGKASTLRMSRQGAHVRQVRHLRYSGIPHVFLLLEGDMNQCDAIEGPRVRFEGQTGPDVINSKGDLYLFIAQMIAEGWGPHRVSLLQTHGDGTKYLLAAVAYVFRHLESVHSACSLHCCKQRGVPYREVAWNQTNREKQLERDLCVAGVHEEVAARVVQRFGSWDTLRQVFCLTERLSSGEQARRLLEDLASSTTSSGWTSALGAEVRGDDEGSGSGWGGSSGALRLHPERLQRDSRVVCALAMLPDAERDRMIHEQVPVAIERGRCVQAKRHTDVLVNSTMHALLVPTSSVECGENKKVAADDEDEGDVFSFAAFPEGICVHSLPEDIQEGAVWNESEAGMSCTGDAPKQKARRVRKSDLPRLPPAWARVETAAVVERSEAGGSGSGSRAAPVSYAVVLGGDLVVEALVRATELVGPPPLLVAPSAVLGGLAFDEDNGANDGVLMAYLHGIVESALQVYLSHFFPPECPLGDKGFKCPSQSQNQSQPLSQQHGRGESGASVLVVEGLSMPNSRGGAIHRLLRELNEIDNLTASSCSLDKVPRTIKLTPNGEELEVSAARAVAKHFAVLVSLLVVSVDVECGWQVLQSRGTAETRQLVALLVMALHKHSLLIL